MGLACVDWVPPCRGRSLTKAANLCSTVVEAPGPPGKTRPGHVVTTGCQTSPSAAEEGADPQTLWKEGIQSQVCQAPFLTGVLCPGLLVALLCPGRAPAGLGCFTVW